MSRGQVPGFVSDVGGGEMRYSVLLSHSRLQVLPEKGLLLMSLYKYICIVALKSTGSYYKIELSFLGAVSTKGWPKSSPGLFAAACL